MMRRKPLQKRLDWLENDYADDPAFWIRRVLKTRRVTMSAYFFGCNAPRVELCQLLGLPEEAVDSMTYEEIALRIAAIARDKEIRGKAMEMGWRLAVPYIRSWHRRCRNGKN